VAEGLNIIDTAIRSGVFQTFTRLLEGSVLERKLRSEVSYTLFAPMDVAFAFLPPETFETLLRAQSEGVLVDVLSYHAVQGKLMLDDLETLVEAKSVHGEKLSISHADDLKVEGAKVLQVDIGARNGVIHGIDRLLVPSKLAGSASVFHCGA
jgi:uncharacterized surface protein with fasciclin (FAS1) repeats